MRWLGIAILGLVGAAQAAPRTPCDSCEACTEALAKPGANVDLKGPLTATAGGICVTIAGDGATFNAIGQPIQVADTAIAVTGADVLLRQPQITQAKVGVRVTGARATVFGAQVTASDTGILVDGAADARLDRVEINGGQVGVAFGAPTGQACAAGATLRSPAAVVQRAVIKGAQVGLAACEARPVVLDSELSGNQIGLLLGDPRAAGAGPGQAGPYDSCACAPALDQVQPGTTLFFSSGCGGCKVHEGFLPDVRGRGHDVRLRETGAENKAKMDAYDAFVRRCAPGIIDAIGTPGCVPNYACLSTGDLFKRKGADGRLVFEHRLNDADGVSEFAAKCASAGASHYGAGAACVQHQIRGLKACGNAKAGVVLAGGAVTGAENACGGEVPGLGCTEACGATAAAAPKPAAPKAAPKAVTPTSAAPKAAPKHSAARPGPTTATSGAGPASLAAEGKGTKAVPANPDDTDRKSPMWVMVAGLAILAAGAAFFLRKGKRG